MDALKKFGVLIKSVADDSVMEKINAQTMRPLTADEVFVFHFAACDNVVDRDNERFTEDALDQMADLFVGRPVLCDHHWSSSQQVARVFEGEVSQSGDLVQLLLGCYMIRNDQTAPTIAAIEGGILRECSVGLSVRRALCSICGKDKTVTCCPHCPGQVYDGEKCHVDLDDPTDAYEVSFVAVPAQPGAGVVKSYGGEGKSTEKPSDPSALGADQIKALALLELGLL